jgi:GrpB-like predicted nucleotidyltransferase (UPF0157 family)
MLAAAMAHGQPPIQIDAYDPSWPARFEAERVLLAQRLQPWLAGPIEHIGSTAVPGLMAKPVIDIMGGVASLEASRAAIPALRELRYLYYPYRAEVMHWFCKPSDQERTHHLHLVPFEAPLWHARLKFRDALRADAALAQRSQELKLELATRFRDDREAYTEHKTAFIQAVAES